MVWFFERDTESLRLETRFDNDTNEFVAIVHWTHKPKQIERFSDATSFQMWLTTFEGGLAKQQWRTTGAPRFSSMAGPTAPLRSRIDPLELRCRALRVATSAMHHPIPAALLVVLTALPAAAQTIATSASGVELASLDRNVDRCTDFYQFACGGWEARNPLPADRRSFSRVQELQDRNFAILRRILETPGGDADRAKASDYYAACMNEPAIEAKGLAPLSVELRRVAALKRRDELPALVAHLQDVATILPGPAQRMSTPLFGFGSGADFKDATRRVATLGTSRVRATRSRHVPGERRAGWLRCAKSTEITCGRCSCSPASRRQRRTRARGPCWQSRRHWPEPRSTSSRDGTLTGPITPCRSRSCVR